MQARARPPQRATQRAGTPTTGDAFDPSSITGSADLGHWDSSPAENDALDCALQGFALTYPNVAVTNELVSATTPRRWLRRFGAHNPPDVFYVNGEAALDWITRASCSRSTTTSPRPAST